MFFEDQEVTLPGRLTRALDAVGVDDDAGTPTLGKL